MLICLGRHLWNLNWDCWASVSLLPGWSRLVLVAAGRVPRKKMEKNQAPCGQSSEQAQGHHMATLSGVTCWRQEGDPAPEGRSCLSQCVWGGLDLSVDSSMVTHKET